jgi:hypothetical protein
MPFADLNDGVFHAAKVRRALKRIITPKRNN